MAQMSSSLKAYDDADNYPRNIIDGTLAPYVLDAIRIRLNTQASRLFSDEDQAALDFLDLGSHSGGILRSCPQGIIKLKVNGQIFGRVVSKMLDA